MKATQFISTLARWQPACKKATGYFSSAFLLVIRLFWGWQFFITGKGKLTHLQQTTEYFKELAIPFPQMNAAMAGTTECVGGLLLMIGLASRLTAIPLIVTMIVAYLTADTEAAKAIFSDPDSFTAAAPFLFLFASLIVLAFGPGKFSADHLISKFFIKPRLADPATH